MGDEDEEFTYTRIRLASQRIDSTITSGSETLPLLYTPGEKIKQGTGFMRGHGTYMDDDNDTLRASVAGVVEQVSMLVSVRPLKNRYNGEVGDVVVGRITEVQQKRWKVDTNSRQDSVLLLSSVNLPGGELRRRSAEDQQMMRKYLQEGDLISAEVQQLYMDGSLSLYTRSLRYGKAVPREDREAIARLRNCILALANSKMLLYDTSIQYAFESSRKYEVSELLNPEPMLDVAVLTQQRLLMQEDV
ncbi:exosome complex component RRP4 isoform X2 [Anabrus simplex]|uniref:exosome complex component RRP4 isoform X2 n=1 Tax=Anabrus simplex TaxID=316456 RepID=UPI0034DD7445